MFLQMKVVACVSACLAVGVSDLGHGHSISGGKPLSERAANKTLTPLIAPAGTISQQEKESHSLCLGVCLALKPSAVVSWAALSDEGRSSAHPMLARRCPCILLLPVGRL